MDVLGVADASVVADIGAGSGWFTIRLAHRVGPNGMVYAEDVQQEMVNAITRRVTEEGFSNVVPVLGEPADPRFPRAAMGKLDAILIVGVYHEIGDRVAMLKKLAEALNRKVGSASSISRCAAAGQGHRWTSGWTRRSW